MKNILLTLLGLATTFTAYPQLTYTVNSLVVHEKPSKKKELIKENSQIIPFDLAGGLIMVDTEINGENAFCIFDTGAPSVIINKEQASMESANGVAIGVTGSMKMNSVVVRDFVFGKLKQKNINGIEIDLSHIEKLKNRVIHGIIGVGAYKKEEVLINYKKEEIELLPKKRKKKTDTRTLIASIPFMLNKQLPVIKIKIGKKNYYFGVDTGAEINVIDQKLLKKLKKANFEFQGERKLAGVGKGQDMVRLAVLDQFKIKKQIFKEEAFAFMDLDPFNENCGMQLDGILGFPFLKNNLISFDFRRSRLNFWKEK